jgi:hypothetical protein
VPHLLVSGRIQRGATAPSTIQKINCSSIEETTYGYVYESERLSEDPDWLPNIELHDVGMLVSGMRRNPLQSLSNPDDYEDIVAAFLQSTGWTLIKSTCFRSKPMFEFVMAKPGPSYAHVQVKSGRVQLAPLQYKDWVKPDECVYLFSTHPDPYPGRYVQRVITLQFDEILSWVESNTWASSPGLLIKLQLSTIGEL